MARLVSVNVGMPQDVSWQGRTVHTGIWKRPVAGRQMVRRLNIDGDGQGDLAGHGGEQRAVLVYQLDSYRHWQEQFGQSELEYGQFGENFTVDGLPDDEVCIGDRYRIGEAEFEVTQPRVTCFRVGMRMGQPQLPALLVSHRRPGFYLRVITEGRVQAGDEIVRTRIGRHALSVADTDTLLYLPGRDVDVLRKAVDIPALSPGWQQSFRELLDAAADGRVASGPAVGVEPGWTGFRQLRVARLVSETPDVTSIYVRSVDDQPLPRPRAGQYLTLRARAAGDPAPVRSYSLSSSPASDSYRISVKREEHGAVSSYLHTALRTGAIIEAAAPRGEFTLGDDARPVVLISAGIGVTPMIAMLHQLADDGDVRQVWWIHTAKDRQRHALADEAHALLRRLPGGHEHVFYTSPAAVPSATTQVGRPTADELARLHLPTDAVAYICGPPGFMTDIATALAGLGIAAQQIHTELFGARTAINPGVVEAPPVTPHQPAGPQGAGPRITFARSGLTVNWAERHGSILALADSCDVPTRYSCRSGVCHTCATPVLSGEISYSPLPLEQPAAGEVLICCARPAGELVLDL